MQWRASAKFVKVGSHLFRTKTELVFGDKAIRLIGVVVMINPGSSLPIGPLDVMGDATIDRTMRIVIRIAESAFEKAGRSILAGDYLQVCNLFDLCEPKLDRAIELLQKMHNAPGDFGYNLHASIKAIPQDAPWVWLAWGLDGRLNNEKVEALKLLIGKQLIGANATHKEYGYYHPGYV